MSRPAIEIERRKPLTPKQRAELFATHDGRCYLCGEKIKAGEPWDDEHVIQRWVSGDDSLANRRPAHRLTCHKVKTAKDATVRAKVKRLIAREDGTRRPRQPIPSRGFSDKTRGFDGQIKLTRKAMRHIERSEG
jgi:hypothetical protein